MTVQVLFFAILRERVQRDRSAVDLPSGATVGILWDILCQQHPPLLPMSSCVSFAVNQEYVDRGAVLRSGDEVALIPPVSGG